MRLGSFLVLCTGVLLYVNQAALANEVRNATDNPVFNSSGNSLWGPGGGGNTVTFHEDILDISDSGTLGAVLEATYLHEKANAGPDVQFLCPNGTFLDIATGDCYSCPDGYNHNPLLSASDENVCSKIHGPQPTSRMDNSSVRQDSSPMC